MKLVLTALGEERPGLVASLSDIVAAHGGNWLESQMAILSGMFAGIVLVELPDAEEDGLREAVAAVDGLAVTVTRAGQEQPERDAPGGILVIHLVGQDHPGIVRDVSTALVSWGVTIEELVTTTRDAPMGDGRLFEADAVVTLPAETSADDVQAVLEGLAGDLVVDIDVDVVAG